MISHLANIDAGATIGKNVSIQSFTTIYDDVIIGDETEIGANVTIYSGARIGKNCKIFPGAVISAEPQDLKFGGEYTTTEIGDGTIIRECVTIHRGTNDRKKTVIGDNCLLMCYVHIGHDCLIGNNVIIANSSGISGHVTIEDWAIMTSVRKNVPPFIRAAREPLAYAGINAIGLRRRRISDEKLKMIEDIYRNLYILNNSISSGVSSIESEIPDSDEKKLVLEFIKDSKKGIIKGPL